MEAVGMDSYQKLQNGCHASFSGSCCRQRSSMPMVRLKIFIMLLMLSAFSTSETTTETLSSAMQTDKDTTKQILLVGTSSTTNADVMSTVPVLQTTNATFVYSRWTTSISGSTASPSTATSTISPSSAASTISPSSAASRTSPLSNASIILPSSAASTISPSSAASTTSPLSNASKTSLLSNGSTISPSSAASTTSLSSAASTARRTPIKDDFILVEMVRLVFKGNVGTSRFANRVYGLLESFLKRAAREMETNDDSDWWFDLTSTLQPINFENTTTYMDFRIKHTLPNGILSLFKRFNMASFISQNSNLVLLAECWPSRNCQNSSMVAVLQPSYFEQNITMFSIAIVLGCLCLVVVVTGLACSCLRRMQNSKKGNDGEPKKTTERPQDVDLLQSALSQDQVKSEVRAQETTFRAYVVDDDDVDNMRSTWVIPLDQAPGRQAAVMLVTAQDTKL